MHQKQPPAKIAVLVAGEGELWPRLKSTKSGVATLKSRATTTILVMIPDLRQSWSRFVPTFRLVCIRSDCHKGRSFKQLEIRKWLKQPQLSARVVESADCRLIPSPLVTLKSLVDLLDLEKTFGRHAPLHVDLGCGDVSFLCALG